MIGHIYVIYYEGDIVYVGSTIDMKTRLYGYKTQCFNKNSNKYHLPLHVFMREKGFDNFDHEIIESHEIEERKELNQYEGMWQKTFTELGFKLLNKQNAGFDACEYGSEGYEANLKKRLTLTVICDHCGLTVVKDRLARHKRTQKCINKITTTKEPQVECNICHAMITKRMLPRHQRNNKKCIAIRKESICHGGQLHVLRVEQVLL